MIVIRSGRETIKLAVSDPNDTAAIAFDEDSWLADELKNKAYGFRTPYNPNACSAFDLIAALVSISAEYEVLEGAEILSMPEETIPANAIP